MADVAVYRHRFIVEVLSLDSDDSPLIRSLDEVDIKGGMFVNAERVSNDLTIRRVPPMPSVDDYRDQESAYFDAYDAWKDKVWEAFHP